MFPRRGKFFRRPRWALIFPGGGGRIQAARAAANSPPVPGLIASGRALVGWPGALLVQQIAEPLAELVKVFALAGE